MEISSAAVGLTLLRDEMVRPTENIQPIIIKFPQEIKNIFLNSSDNV